MSEQLIIRLDPKTKVKLSSLSKSEGKSTSQVLRELIDQYIREHDLSGYLDDLWGRVGKRIQSKGFGAGDVPKAIREARKASRR